MEDSRTNMMAGWTLDDIVDWIIELEGGRYKEYEQELRYGFDVGEINGDNIIDLSVDDLKDFGIKEADKYDLWDQIQNYDPTENEE